MTDTPTDTKDYQFEFSTLLASQPKTTDPNALFASLDALYTWLNKNTAPLDSIRAPYYAQIAEHHDVQVKVLKREAKAHAKAMAAAEADEAAEQARQKAEAGRPAQPKWMSDLCRHQNGLIKGVIYNTLLFLGHADDWKDALAYDEFKCQPVWLRDPPWKTTTAGKSLTDDDAGRFQAWLNEHDCDVSYDTAFRALEVAARNNSYHPIREYLRSTKWDGTPRVESFYTRYFGVDDTPYARLVSRIHLISSVARIEQPGCKVDTTIVLEGAQGIRKSSSLEKLYGKQYFRDQLSDLSSKDAMQELLGIWGVEMAELDTLTKPDASLAKRFMSSGCDKFRAPYGRKVEDHPRQCVLMGSINPDGDLGYLKDQTGNRRYLPLRIERGDVDAIERDRDQIWAEAFHLYQRGVKWWATAAEDKLCQDEQEERRQKHPWEDAIAQFVNSFDHPTVTKGFILDRLLDIPLKLQNSAHGRSVASIMKRLGWLPKSKGTARYYLRSTDIVLEKDHPLDPPPHKMTVDSAKDVTGDDLGRMANATANTGTPKPNTAAPTNTEEWPHCSIRVYELDGATWMEAVHSHKRAVGMVDPMPHGERTGNVQVYQVPGCADHEYLIDQYDITLN